MPILPNPDTLEVRDTARLLLAGFPDDAMRIASALADDSLETGDFARAELWSAILVVLAQLKMH